MSLFRFKKNTPDEGTPVADIAGEETSKSRKKNIFAKLSLKNNRKLRIGTTATAVTAAVAAMIVLLNVVVGIINDRFPLAWDLTADKTYTLSEESLEVAEKVVDEVTITVFTEESFFEDPSTTSEDVNTLLRQFYQFTNDYHSLTDGKVVTEYIDLDANPTLESAYTKYNATAGSILFRCGEQWRTITLNDLYSEEYAEDYYYTGATTVTSLVEQKLAVNINAVCGGKTVALTFLTGHGEDENYINELQELYEMNGYTTHTVNYATAVDIDPNTGALIIMAPTEDYSADEISRLRAWLYNNGKRERDLFVFCHYAADCPNLYEFLAADYGITVTDKLIVETDEERMRMDSYGGNPYIPLTAVQETDITGEVGNGNIVMPLTLQLLTEHSSDTDEYALTNHAMVTFPESARLMTMKDLMDENATEDSGVQEEADEYPVVGMAYAYEYEYDGDLNELANHVVVSGSYQMIGFMPISTYLNEELLLEPVRTTCSLGDTTVISGKDLSADTVTYNVLTANIVGFGVFTVGIPLIMIIIALVVFIKRRHL